MKLTKILSFCLAATFFVGCAQKRKDTLNVYAIIHDEEAKALTDLFTERTGILVSYFHASTGEIINRVIAEKDNPKADVLLGGARSHHIQIEDADALTPYVSPNAANAPEYARASSGAWTGFCILTIGVGINKERFAAKFPEQEYPKTWEDLLNPAFKGEIVMTDPAASSTAYLFVQNQLQRLGWDDGWNYLLALAPLVGQFPDSGSAPSKLVGTGEYAVGISYLHALAKYRAQGFGVDLIPVPQAVGDVDCVAILKGAKQLAAAQQFVDFILSAEGEELMSSISFTTPVNPNAKAKSGIIPIEKIDLIEYDFQKAASQRNEVIARWKKEIK